MAGFISYQIENEQSLKEHSQELVDKVAFELGFKTKRKEVRLAIRFAKGASHTNWRTGQTTYDAEELARLLVRGFRSKHGERIRPRPFFKNYMNYYSEDVRDIVIETFRIYSHWSVTNRCYMAGKRILEDFKRKVYTGSLGLAGNQGKYALRKIGAGYGDLPLVVTKAMFEALEVVVE